MRWFDSCREHPALVLELGDVPEQTKARIVEAAEGNPLFVEQLLAIQAESGNGELEIPPTIQALLAEARRREVAPDLCPSVLTPILRRHDRGRLPSASQDAPGR